MQMAIFGFILLFLLFGHEAAPAGFTVAGKKVEPLESNFAGSRQKSPTFGIVVQLNHDLSSQGELELTLVDAAFQAQLDRHRRPPFFRRDYFPIIFITEQKFKRFSGSDLRRGLGRLEDELKREDVYVSPSGIFISEAAFQDERQLKSALFTGLGYLFHQEFYEHMRRFDPSLAY